MSTPPSIKYLVVVEQHITIELAFGPDYSQKTESARPLADSGAKTDSNNNMDT